MYSQQNIKLYFFCKKYFSTVSVCQHSWYTHQIAWICASDFQKICRCVMIKRLVIITQLHEGKDRPINISRCINYVRLITYARTYLLTQPDGNLKSPPALNKRHASSESPPSCHRKRRELEHKWLKERHGISLHDSVINTDLKSLVHKTLVRNTVSARVRLKPDGTRWRTGGKVKGKLANGVLSTTSEHGVCSITTADAHTSAASSRLNWRPRRFKSTRPFRRKKKSGFSACAITFQTQSTNESFRFKMYI